MNSLLVDSGFWYALYTPRDQFHQKAIEIEPFLANTDIIFPYPTLYEVLNTAFVKDKTSLLQIKELINSPNSICIDDSKYLSSAIELTLKKENDKSLVDNIIRLMLEDINLKINGLITFNARDFYDVCATRGIVLIYD